MSEKKEKEEKEHDAEEALEKKEHEHKEKHECEHVEKHEKAGKKTSIQLTNNLMVLLAAIFIGGLILGGVIGMFLGPKGETIPTETELKAKLASYLNENFFTKQGLSVEIKTMEEVEDLPGIYSVKFDVMKGTEVLQKDAETYTTKDGKNLIIGNVLNLDKPLELPETNDTNEQTEPESKYPKEIELEPLTTTEKPLIELFVMSHCPFGTQIEKGILPVLDLIGDKVDFKLKFVYYAMHGEKELKEELNQHCIQKEFPEKLKEYLYCFLKEGKGTECITETGLDSEKIASCATATDTEFLVMANFNETSTWIGGNYPPFNVYAEDNTKYNVGGSPTLVINETTVESYIQNPDGSYTDTYYTINGEKVYPGRDSASLLKIICSTVTEQPEKCAEELSSTTPSSGFGFEGTGTGTSGGCGA